MSRSDDLLVLRQRSAVTAFDMHVELSRDGRERGLWIFLDDQSDERDKRYNQWIDGAIEIFVKMMGYKGEKKKNLAKFSAWLSLDGELRKLAGGKVREAVLLEWPAIEKFYKAMGKAIRNGKLAQKIMDREENERCLRMTKKSSTRASSSSTSRQKNKRKTTATQKRARST